jgi:transposase
MGERRFREYERRQDLLLPPSLEDWLPEKHLARFISDAADALDLREWEWAYATETGSGAPPFHPVMMLKVLVYGYATGTFSSRKLAAKCVEDVAFRYLAAQATPDFRSFLKFRKRHLQRFEKLFVQVVQLAQEAGLVKLGRIALDGSKFKANASKHKAMSYERMREEEKRLHEEIHGLIEQAHAVDAAEETQYGNEDGYSLPDALAHREQRLKTIEAAKGRLEERARQRAEAEVQRREAQARERAEQGKKPKRYKKEPDPTPKPKEQENFTDPDSRIMRDGATKGFVQAYNTQIAVDDAHQIIVATDLDNQACDQGHFVPVLDAVKENTGTYPDEALADAGYKSEETFKALDDYPTEAYVACGREAYDPRVPCPAEPLPQDATATQHMERKLLTPNGRKIYRKRKSIVEPVFGWIKNVLGFRQLSLRGQANARGEWHLVCLALNLRRMAAMA